MIENRLKGSYYAAKSSQKYALKLQAIDPAIQDAWLTRGFSKRLLASAPFVIRWLMKIDQMDGDNAPVVVAISNPSLKICSPLRAADHPENQVVRMELAKMPKS